MFSKIASYGIVLSYNALPDREKYLFGGNTISHYVIAECLKQYSQAIENSDQWKEHRLKEKVWIGQGPHETDGSRIHKYLWHHSMRKGVLGKLAGLIHRVKESTKEFLYGKSERLTARNEIVNLLWQIKILEKDEYQGGIEAAVNLVSTNLPSKNDPVYRKADEILKGMLNFYNIYAVSKGAY